MKKAIKVKDLSKVILNPQDVMIKALVKTTTASGLDLSLMAKKDLESLEEVISMVIVARGKDVEVFNTGDYVFIKNGVRMMFEILDAVDTLQQRLFVVSMFNIEYAVNPDNYEL